VSELASPDRVRTAQEVFDHHLQAFGQGLDALVADYTEHSSIFLKDQTITGLAGIRAFFDAFLKGIQPGFWDAFKIVRQDVSGDTAYLVWEAAPFIKLATDTLLIRNGKIHVQTFTALA
jgi:ketosteroid isomerase-like protein